MVKLVSETFNYSRLDRQKAKMKRNIDKHFPTVGRHFHRIGLRPKVSILLHSPVTFLFDS